MNPTTTSTETDSTFNTAATIDLTSAAPSDGQGPTIDLRNPGRQRPQNQVVDVDFLARVLVDQEIPPERPLDLTVTDLTITDDEPNSRLVDDRTWGSWALQDDTALGDVVSPRIVATARRLFKMMQSGRPLLNSPGTYYQTHRRFSADYVRRNLTPAIHERCRADAETNLAVKTDESDASAAAAEVLYAAQYRLEYFVGLPDAEFEACYRFTGEITRDYLLHTDRSDRLYSERTETAPMISAGDRRKRKSRSLEHV